MKRVTAVVLALLLGACGVPGGDDMELVEPEAVPFGLLEDDREVAEADEDGSAVLEVFLVADDPGVLVPVERQVGSPSLASVLEELAAGPTAAEAAMGLRSAIPDRDVVARTTLDNGTATVDLTEDFPSLGGSDQLLAIAQIVLSLTERPGVERVAFTLDGDRVEVPRGDGSLTSGSVSRDAYVPLLRAGP